MELRIMAEHMKETAEKLEGAAYILGALGILLAIHMGRQWYKRRDKKYLGLLKIGILLLGCMSGIIGWKAEAISAGSGMNVKKQWEVTFENVPEYEKDGVWCYKEEAVIKIERELCEPDKAEHIKSEILISIWDEKEEWKVIGESEWEEHGIKLEETNTKEEHEINKVFSGRVMFGEEMRVKVELPDGEKMISQEIIVDQTPPQLSLEKVISKADGKILNLESGTYISKDMISINLRCLDKTGTGKIICKGKNEKSGNIVFEREISASENLIKLDLPEDFFGYLIWEYCDRVGNQAVWEQEEKYCCESVKTHHDTGVLKMESLEENDGFCQDTLHIRLRGEDNWSGIKRISLMKNGSVLLEERMNQRPGEVIQWERIITIPAEDNEKITLQAELEDMAGHVTRVSDSWMCDIQAPYVSARFEDEKGKIESTENGYLKNTGNLILYVEEIWFRPELWDISWIEHPGRKPDISWTRNENTYMCVIPIYEEGNYELQISGGDLAGNIMQTAYGEGQWNLQWILDITSPEITIQGVKNAEQYNGDIQMKIAIKDTGLNNEKLSCRLVGAGKGEIQIYEESNQDRNTDPKTKIFLWNPPKNEDWDDTYHLVVEAYDQAGNQNIKNMDFVVNRRGSKYLVSGMEKGTVFSSYPHINISEENLSQVIDHRILYTWEGESRILENGKDYRISEKTEGNYMKYTYHLKETLFLRDGNYTFVVLSEDAAGNKGSSLKNKVASMPIRFSVDRTSPSVIVNLDNPQGDDDNKGASVRILENQTLKNIKIWKDDEKIPVLINNEDYENILLEDERLKGWDKLKIEVEDEAGNIWVENIENSQKKSGEKTNEKPAEVKLMEEKNSTQKDVIIGWILSLAGVGGGIVKKIKKIKK